MPVMEQEQQVFGTRLASGVAQAELQPDGSVVVRDVPLFAEIRPEDPGAKDGMRTPRDRAWLELALRKTRERIAAGKKPIMTLRHYFDAPERVGHYEPTKIDVAEVNPGEQPRPVVFGDKVYESREAFEKSKDYDFRSIEISPDAPEEFSALALLRDKEPYHKFPNLRERLAQAGSGAAEAFSSLCFRAMVEASTQVWKGAPESFEARREKNPTTKEGSMPPVETEKNAAAPTFEERVEACLAKFEERVMKSFEERFGKAAGLKKDGDADDKKPEAAAAKPEGEKPAEEKKPEAAAAHAAVGPNASLPPAVAQARAPEAFSAQMAAQDQTILGLRARVERMEREKAATAIVAGAKKALLDMGCSAVTESFEAAAFKAAVDGGQTAVDALVGTVKIGMGLVAPRGPEAFGALGGVGGSATGARGEDEFKKAVETFASRPENAYKIPIIQAAHREWMSSPEGFRRDFKGGFCELLRGDRSVNDGWARAEVIRG